MFINIECVVSLSIHVLKQNVPYNISKFNDFIFPDSVSFSKPMQCSWSVNAFSVLIFAIKSNNIASVIKFFYCYC